MPIADCFNALEDEKRQRDAENEIYRTWKAARLRLVDARNRAHQGRTAEEFTARIFEFLAAAKDYEAVVRPADIIGGDTDTPTPHARLRTLAREWMRRKKVHPLQGGVGELMLLAMVRPHQVKAELETILSKPVGVEKFRELVESIVCQSLYDPQLAGKPQDFTEATPIAKPIQLRLELTNAGFTLCGQPFRLPGKPRLVLGSLIKAGDNGVSVSQLLDEHWKDNPVTEDAVRGHVLKVRHALRKAVDRVAGERHWPVNLPVPPINFGEGRTAWVVDLVAGSDSA